MKKLVAVMCCMVLAFPFLASAQGVVVIPGDGITPIDGSDAVTGYLDSTCSVLKVTYNFDDPDTGIEFETVATYEKTFELTPLSDFIVDRFIGDAMNIRVSFENFFESFTTSIGGQDETFQLSPSIIVSNRRNRWGMCQFNLDLASITDSTNSELTDAGISSQRTVRKDKVNCFDMSVVNGRPFSMSGSYSPLPAGQQLLLYGCQHVLRKVEEEE